MDQALADRLERYRAQYPEAIRGLAETYCSATTRLGAAGAPPATVNAVQSMANNYAVDVHLLVAAITEYSQIESALEKQALDGFRRGATASASSAPAAPRRRWWWPWS